MGKQFFFQIFICFTFLLFFSEIYAQNEQESDTFFLAKRKGLMGKLAKSIMRTPESEPVKIANPFIKYSGRFIRSVVIFPLGFNQRLDDTAAMKQNLAIRLANQFHKNTRTSVIRNYLFFKKGDKVLPLQLSDNEKFLRDQPFLQDALIVVLDPYILNDSVDIVVLTRDVFSIGGNINANTRRVRTELREENLIGTGNQISVSGIYDKDRSPNKAFGAEFILRNIRGSFLNWTTGINNFQRAFNSDHDEVQSYYTLLEKPLVNRYTQWTGSLELSKNQTSNGYDTDSLYKSDYQYQYTNIDLWAGNNIGYKTKKGRDSEHRLRHFVAGRVFYHQFSNIPQKFESLYHYDYADIKGVLFAYNLYKQNFFRTNFIYAFGRNEDVPVGLSASLIAGWANKAGLKRPYYGAEFAASRLSPASIFSSYKVRAGGFYRKGRLEDIDLLLSIDHFTRLLKFNSRWLNRNFISFSFTRQLNDTLNSPLYIRSEFGLPYFYNGLISADERASIRMESVFFNLNKFLGFRLAPFIFGDFSFLKPKNQPFHKVDGYGAIGGGVRARNENLVFGTIELRGYYFPRTVIGMNSFKVDVVSKLRFKFNTTFIKKPDFIVTN